MKQSSLSGGNRANTSFLHLTFRQLTWPLYLLRFWQTQVIILAVTSMSLKRKRTICLCWHLLRWLRLVWRVTWWRCPKVHQATWTCRLLRISARLIRVLGQLCGSFEVREQLMIKVVSAQWGGGCRWMKATVWEAASGGGAGVRLKWEESQKG